MILKEHNALPNVPDHFCECENVAEIKIVILKIKSLSKNIESLQSRYCKLNDKYKEIGDRDTAKESLNNAYKNLFSLHQRRIEATAYTVIHLSNNLSRIAGWYYKCRLQLSNF